jgi:hypothetical protein
MCGFVEVEHVRRELLGVARINGRYAGTNQRSGIGVVRFKQACPIVGWFTDIDLRPHSVHRQSLGHTVGHIGWHDESNSIAHLHQYQRDDNTAFRVTPGGRQPSGIGKQAHVLGQLALQKFDGVCSAYCDQFVQLATYLWHTSRMVEDSHKPIDSNDSAATSKPDDNVEQDSDVTPPEKEIGGRDGPDPTRYGDWEKNGRCIDF